MRTAIMVDAGFFLKRFPRIFPRKDRQNAGVVAKALYSMCLAHLTQKNEESRRYLHRIFVYDCPPFDKKRSYPISKKTIDFTKTDVAQFRLAFHTELKKMRLVALRLGHLRENGEWRLYGERMKEVLKGTLPLEDLTDDHFFYEVRQKGVDMKIGLDIATLGLKRQVDQIVLIAGDSDFVPAAKLARREGIDFVLDPLWNPIHEQLHEHIDGLRSVCNKPKPPARK